MIRDSRVLVVDDEATSLDLMERILTGEGVQVTAASSGSKALEQLEGNEFDLVVSDIRMPGLDGMQLLDLVRQKWTETPVILVTAFGNVDDAMRAIKRGAYDYISKPYNVDNIVVVVERALRQRKLSQENRNLRRAVEPYRLVNIVGSSNAMLEVYKTVARVASSNVPVLITGESGTGKELVARTIHAEGSKGPFLAINCSAVNEGVLESELFGHRRGAFTGAKEDRQGVFEAANGGTLFMDEIGDLSPRMQAQLLRVLQEGEVKPVGSSESFKVDVRILAATNRDLEKDVRDGRFREDLFYRVNVVVIHLPPLRERTSDVLPLAEHFLRKYATQHDTVLTDAAADDLLAYHWPGNVRELENVVARAVALCRGRAILPEDLPLGRAPNPDAPPVVAAERSQWPSLAELTRAYVDEVLEHVQGNKRRAAELLGVDRKTLYRMIKDGAQRPTSLGRKTAVSDEEVELDEV